MRPMPTDIAKYSIELFKPDGEAIEEILGRRADLKVAQSKAVRPNSTCDQPKTVPNAAK